MITVKAIARWAWTHKFISTVIVLALIGGGYWQIQNSSNTSGQTLYVLGTVATSTIVADVSDAGQVSATNSVDIKPQVSGNVTWVGVAAGQHVAAGQPLVKLDDTTAQQALSNAKASLAAAKLQYQKDAAQAPISYQNDLNALATATSTLQNDYNSMYDDLTSTYLDLPDVMTSAEDVIYGYDFDPKKSQNNMDYLIGLFTTLQDTANVDTFQAAATKDYASANGLYDNAVSAYKLTSRTSSDSGLDSILSQSIAMTTSVAQSLQSELNFLGSVSDLAQTNNIKLPSQFASIQSAARANLSTTNADLSKLLSDQQNIANAKQAITAAKQAIQLDEVGNAGGANPISLQIEANSIKQQEQTVANDEANLSYYTVTAPFDGTLSAVNVLVGDSAGSGTAVATEVSSSQFAELSVNEVDAAKIALGDKATMTFDAIDGLTLTGKVVEIDPVGTVSQGVVSFDVKIAFDRQDPRVKAGMTVNADIQTAVHQNVLTVPSTAVKTQNGQNYVQVFDPPLTETGGSAGVASDVLPKNVPVTTGLSDNTNTEITSGLTGGEQIVVRTNSSGSVPSAAAGATTRGGFGGAGIRI